MIKELKAGDFAASRHHRGKFVSVGYEWNTIALATITNKVNELIEQVNRLTKEYEERELINTLDDKPLRHINSQE